MRTRLRASLAIGGAVAVAVTAAVAIPSNANAAIISSTLVNPISNKCLDVYGGGSANGSQAIIWTCHSRANQLWTSTAALELRVTIGGVTKCLDAYDGGTANGTRAIIWTCHGGNNQKWNLNANGTITGVASGKCLDVAGNSTANGANVQLWTCKTAGNNNQRWVPGSGGTNPPPPPPPGPQPPPPPPGPDTCAVKSRPAGKVLHGYWENWDGASNGVHPGMGWIPITDTRIRQHGYNVINAAFPVILSDGTVKWEDGMDSTVKVATPAEMCAAKAAGLTILLSIGGATAGIDLSSSAVADRFVATVVPILQRYNFDGIDIDIETGLVGSGNINQLSTSQANLIRIIDGVLARMPSNFGLTMAPETAYVTGGSVTYGSIWGAYLPIIKKYMDNGRLWWLNMQYYNGSMYGCNGDSYSAGTVQGFTVQTNCLNAGLNIQGTIIRVPYDRQAPGLPAQPGAGGGYMSPDLVRQAYNSTPGIKGLMTWSINWDGSRNWTFGDNVRSIQGR